ncbi:YolD-like family protein [Bacillaceae bacterium C204]|uniref:YolD-like family protein n=1 Tax=Neobacillus sp. 204 TaxID=3383351 RepID=UPI00397E4EAD
MTTCVFLPLAFEMQRSMFKDRERQRKSLIDENKAEVFNQRICYAIESNLAVKLTVWAMDSPRMYLATFIMLILLIIKAGLYKCRSRFCIQIIKIISNNL